MKKTIPLTYTARQERARLMNHMVPGIVLIVDGIGALSSPEADLHKMVSLIGLAVGAIASILIVREMKHAAHHAHHHTPASIRWVEVAVAAVIALEAAHRYNPRKSFQPAVLYFILSLVTLGQGLFPDGFPKLRKLVLDENGFRLRRNLFIVVHSEWKAITSARFSDASIDFQLASGKTRSLKLGRIGNAGDVSDALYAALQERGIEAMRG